MSFNSSSHQPWFWCLLAFALGLPSLLAMLRRRRRRELDQILGPRAPVLKEGPSSLWPQRCFSFGVLALLLACAGPRWGRAQHSLRATGVELMICLDVSRSMLARDLTPSRLERAKTEIRELSQRARGERIALLLFAGDAQLVFPLTEDLSAVSELLEGAVEDSDLPGGSDLGRALERAMRALPTRPDRSGQILVLSDGADDSGQGPSTAVRCQERGLSVHCIGYGSASGAKIPIEEAGIQSFLQDADGRDVVTALHPAQLLATAAAGGGVYRRAREGEPTLVHLYESVILPKARSFQRTASDDGLEERFQWPLALAILAWLLQLGWSRSR